MPLRRPCPPASAAAGPSVVVNNLAVTSLSVSVVTSMLGSQTQQATVTGNVPQVSNVSLTAAVTNWTSSNPSTLSVSSSGLITANSGGTATVSATVNGVTAARRRLKLSHSNSLASRHRLRPLAARFRRLSPPNNRRNPHSNSLKISAGFMAQSRHYAAGISVVSTCRADVAQMQRFRRYASIYGLHLIKAALCGFHFGDPRKRALASLVVLRNNFFGGAGDEIRIGELCFDLRHFVTLARDVLVQSCPLRDMSMTPASESAATPSRTTIGIVPGGWTSANSSEATRASRLIVSLHAVATPTIEAFGWTSVSGN